MAERINITLHEAASNFLASLTTDERGKSQFEVGRFARWFNRDRNIGDLRAPEIANYAQRLSLSDMDYDSKLGLIRLFLSHAKKCGWTSTNLATHLKTKKGKSNAGGRAKQATRESISLTREGYDSMKAELAELKQKRVGVTEEIRRAAADKDFRENAPLHAAREQKGHIEGRIKELEETLKVAVVMEDRGTSQRAGMGDSVVLLHESSSRELNYMIVHPKEVDASRGRISSESPIGRAIIGSKEDDIVEVSAPAGVIRYILKQIKHTR